MEAQLRLLSAPEPTEQATRHRSIDDAPALEAGPVAWRLSSSTRELGRRGIEHARAALQSARPGHQHSSAA